jgi:hypothetical protein
MQNYRLLVLIHVYLVIKFGLKVCLFLCLLIYYIGDCVAVGVKLYTPPPPTCYLKHRSNLSVLNNSWWFAFLRCSCWVSCSITGHRSGVCRLHPDGTGDLNTPLRSKLRVLNPEVCIIKYFVMGCMVKWRYSSTRRSSSKNSSLYWGSARF